MPYVPPHLRGGSAKTEPAPAPSSRSAGSAPAYSNQRDDRGPPSSSSNQGYSGFSRRDSDRSLSERSAQNGARNGFARSSSSQSFGSSGNGRTGRAAGPWKPSDRVASMTQDQISETRQRLNVSVEAEGEEFVKSAPIESFVDMNVHPQIQADIVSKGYDKPTPIQAQGTPVALSGRDILGCAETGSGKTAAFAIPMIQHCLESAPLRRGDGPIGLILAPTRELAQQIEREVRDFTRSSTSQVRSAIVVGGTNMGEQRGDLRSGVEIVVATPGRFIDHLRQDNTKLNRVSFVVLDEADRMLDMGFEEQIREVMRSLPDDHQTLLFSATMPVEIEALAGDYLNKPVRVKVGQVSTPAANVAQHLQKTTEPNKMEAITSLLLEENQLSESSGHAMPLTIVFVERKARCDEVAELLRLAGLKAAALHGGLSQNEREGALRDFTKGDVLVLVATDVASRGLDIKGIGHVVNLDLPKTFEDYVHRIGRTGRAGSMGRATSLYTDRDSFLVSQIKKAIADLESGNAFAFATGKAARQKEREAAQEFREKLKLGASNIVSTGAGTAVKVDDKYAFMAAAENADTGKAGQADDAWDD